MESTTLSSPSGSRFAQYLALTKPRVTQLAVFCAVIGMFLSTRGMVPWKVLIGGTVGIWMTAGAAFAINCLVEQKIDALMHRTAWRPSARGEIRSSHILIFSAVLGGIGMWVLYTFTNPLTMWLTVATFVGYAIIYTLILKPATPQNIVIGGASGAMPPALGWAAATGHLPAEAWILVLIIFIWTPPHFWALSMYRQRDYVESGLPMLPVTHGERITKLHILLYTVALIAVTVMPFAAQMSGYFYLVCALALGAVFMRFSWQIWTNYSDALSRRAFRYSILYLSLLFAALLIDHYAQMMFGMWA